MKHFWLCLSLAILTGSITSQISQNVTLLSNWSQPSTPSEPVYGIKYNGVWGWVNPNDNKEYAIIGSSEGVYFIEVTIPTAPVVRDYVPGRRNNCIWREIKTYQNYCYMVSDDSSPNSFQIVDLSYLPDSVHILRDDATILERSHTIWIDGNKLYCGIPKGPAVSGSSRMAVFSLSNPTTPTLLRKIESDYPNADYAHDMFVRNDTVYASESYSGLFIYKFNANNTFSLINSLTTYPGQGYNHSTSLTTDGKTLIMLDEVPVGLPCKAVDVTNLGNISVMSTFRSTANSTATPHNPFVKGNNRAIIAYYQDGLQIFDISNPSSVIRTGYYDTNPTDGIGLPNPNYSGCWGAYPWLPSGIILASDMQNGLFVFDANGALLVNENSASPVSGFSTFPNPARDVLTAGFNAMESENLTLSVSDIAGKTIRTIPVDVNQGGNQVNIPVDFLSPGIYFLSISGNDGIYSTQKFVKQ
jgi:choice-of-anchor B domain-containing protein